MSSPLAFLSPVPGTPGTHWCEAGSITLTTLSSQTCLEGSANTLPCCPRLVLAHRGRKTQVREPGSQGGSPSTAVSAREVPGNIIHQLLSSGANASTQGHLKFNGQCHPTASLP